MCKLFAHPGEGCRISRIQGGGFDKGKVNAGGLETPVGVLCFMAIYYVHIPYPIIKLLVSVIQ